MMVHPAPRFTCTNCTGSADALDLSQAPPGAPLYSFSRRTYDGSLAGDAPGYRVWGNLKRMTLNVKNPYSGSSPSVSINPTGQFIYTTVSTFDYSMGNLLPTINLKLAGARIITPVGVTGAQAGDLGLTAPPQQWMSGTLTPHMNTNISSEPASVWPQFEITVETDQGIGN
jgi:hypothetical protein